MNIKFDTEPVYGDNDSNVSTNFHHKKLPKQKTVCNYLSLIMVDSVVKVKKKVLYSNTFGRMQIRNKEIKMEIFINDELEASLSGNRSDSDSDHESDNQPEKPSKKYNNEQYSYEP